MGKRYICCDYCDNTKHKNFHGYQIGDDEMTPHKKVSKGKARKPKPKGCPARVGENKKSHIYVWVEIHGLDWKHKMVGEEYRYGLYPATWYNYECVGCGHVSNRKFWWTKPPENIYSVRYNAGEFSWRMN